MSTFIVYDNGDIILAGRPAPIAFEEQYDVDQLSGHIRKIPIPEIAVDEIDVGDHDRVAHAAINDERIFKATGKPRSIKEFMREWARVRYVNATDMTPGEFEQMLEHVENESYTPEMQIAIRDNFEALSSSQLKPTGVTFNRGFHQ